jgi:hypothetical protein
MQRPPARLIRGMASDCHVRVSRRGPSGGDDALANPFRSISIDRRCLFFLGERTRKFLFYMARSVLAYHLSIAIVFHPLARVLASEICEYALHGAGRFFDD